jgi:signal transduction histidine kinase
VPGTAIHKIAEVGTGIVPAGQLFLVALTTLPLAFRRRYPATAFTVILIAAMATHGDVTSITFLSLIFAAYSAVVYGRFRRMALLTVFSWGVVVTAAFPDTSPPVPSRFGALLVLTATAAVAISIRGWQRRAGDSAERLRRAEAEHEDHTRRAVEAERARIASDLHDVVTHNVSVMVVQAGAARRVLDSSPGDAREALLAVEASGRTAMTELRHLLGLLAPSGGACGEASGTEAVLLPQPDLGQVGSLVHRVRAAGLPVDLTVTGARPLPPGVGLAAYRVVQEALTNVLKHAGQARTTVRIEYRPRDLLITVTDDGPASVPAAPAAGPPRNHPSAAGLPRDHPPRDHPFAARTPRDHPPAAGGRGLIGLRERIAVYQGELDARPRPGGGWRVMARIPLDGAAEPVPAVAM